MNMFQSYRLCLKARSMRETANKLYQFCQEVSSNIQPQLYQKLVDGNQKNLIQVELANQIIAGILYLSLYVQFRLCQK